MSEINPSLDVLSIGMLLHDLRNALGLIVGYSELLLDDMDDPTPAALGGLLRGLRGEGKTILAQINAFAPALRSEPSAEQLHNARSLLTDDVVRLTDKTVALLQCARETHQEMMPDLLKIESAIQKFSALIDLIS